MIFGIVVAVVLAVLGGIVFFVQRSHTREEKRREEEERERRTRRELEREAWDKLQSKGVVAAPSPAWAGPSRRPTIAPPGGDVRRRVPSSGSYPSARYEPSDNSLFASPVEIDVGRPSPLPSEPSTFVGEFNGHGGGFGGGGASDSWSDSSSNDSSSSSSDSGSSDSSSSND
jgi:hypothetical protein